MTMPFAEFYRLDPLTGCNNFLSFVETLDHMSAEKEKRQFSILYTDLNYLMTLNETRGHTYGDSVIRWLGIVLQEECELPIYRIGGDEFAVLLIDGGHEEYEELLHRLFVRLNKEGEQLGIPSPASKIALIHFDPDTNFSINDVMFHLGETIRDVKRNNNATINIYWARDLIKSTAKAEDQNPENINRSWEILRSIANQSINRVLLMGRVLDVVQKTSFIDSISGLPNMRAALLKMEKSLASKQPFSIMLIDGDNLRLYNTINYAAGDEVIQKMGIVFTENLRPGDFIARWRSGDEFIAILANTSSEGALVVGDRFCSGIREASKNWAFPTSISIGVATYPRHGEHINALVDVAEAANKQAKDEGKDRVVLAE